MRETIAEIHRRMSALMEQAESERGSRACAVGEGIESCRDPGACRFREDPATCPRKRRDLDAEACARRMDRAGVPRHQRALLDAAMLGGPALRATRSLRAVRSFLDARDRRLLVLAGGCGIGKTVAACYALAKLGGVYTTAYRLARLGFDLDAMIGAKVLVIDQLGREHDPRGFGRQTLEELVDARYAGDSLTILVGNLSEAEFTAAYEGVIADRMREVGQFVFDDSPSLRGRA